MRKLTLAAERRATPSNKPDRSANRVLAIGQRGKEPSSFHFGTLAFDCYC
jgi:hypothetical protein